MRATSKGYTPAEIVLESKAPAMLAVGNVQSQPARTRTAAPAPAPAPAPAAKPAAPAEIQKLNAEIKRLQQELTVKEQANQELQLKLNEKR